MKSHLRRMYKLSKNIDIKGDVEKYNKYPGFLRLLTEEVDSHEHHLIMRFIDKFNFRMKNIHVLKCDTKLKIFLFDLTKEHFKRLLKLNGNYTTDNRGRIRGYIMAKWREYVRLIRNKPAGFKVRKLFKNVV